MARVQTKNTWVLVASGMVALALVTGVVALDSFDAPITGVLRGAALLGYISVFLAALSSNYMRELTRFFGRPFIKVHHVVTVMALVALSLHATLVAWRAGTPRTFLPDFRSFYLFFSLGGRPAFWLLAVTSLTALLRASIGKSWKVIHWLNYVALLLGTVHALLIGPNFEHAMVRIIAVLMAAGALVVFAFKRVVERNRHLKAQARRG